MKLFAVGSSSFIVLLLSLSSLLFFAGVWFLSTSIMKLNPPEKTIEVLDFSGNKTYGDLRIISIENFFSHPVSLYFQDNEAGVFISTIASHDKVDVRAADNHLFFATAENDVERLGTITVRDGVSEYYLLQQKTTRKLPLPRNGQVKYVLDAKQTERLHPQITLTHSKSLAMAAKFRSLSSRMLDLWFDDGGDGIWEGHLKMGQETTTNTYVGHVFIITVSGKKKEVVARCHMVADQVTYVITDKGYPATKKIVDQNAKEERFTKSYYNMTGIHWRHYYGPEGPRPPPKLFMWPADKIGQVHTVESPEGVWHCGGKESRCRHSDPIKLDLEVVSLTPRAFIIPNFLSDYEADSIVKQASPHIATSSVGDADVGIQNSDTRTSKNTWLNRYSSLITQSIFLRAADVLAIDDALLVPGKNAEDLQVVHYEHGQKYDAHHDWGVSGHPESRLVTLLLYLSDQKDLYAGGETAFPKGNEGLGFKVRPKKGNAVLFYNLLEDGNGDDLALHASLPTMDGEKWLCNFWIWDPSFHH